MINISEILAKIKPTVLGWMAGYLVANGYGRWVMLHDPFYSTSFYGDTFSTTAKTLIDLSATFGVPGGIKAISITVSMRDSGSAASNTCFILSPNNVADQGFFTRTAGISNDYWHSETHTIPCDANGDVYYQVIASGASTLDVYLEIWGYLL